MLVEFGGPVVSLCLFAFMVVKASHCVSPWLNEPTVYALALVCGICAAVPIPLLLGRKGIPAALGVAFTVGFFAWAVPGLLSFGDCSGG
jgi:hypothetical protein